MELQVHIHLLITQSLMRLISYLSMASCLDIAFGVTLYFPKEFYVYPNPQMVREGETHVFNNTKDLQFERRVEIVGNLRVQAQDEALVRFERLYNHVDASINVWGRRDLEIIVKEYFSNSIESKFEVHAAGDLTFALESSEVRCMNAGIFNLTAHRINFKSFSDIINDKTFCLTAAEDGEFKFAKLVNLGSLKLRGGALSSSFSFDNLLNSGSLYFSCQMRRGTTVEARGSIDNTGLIVLTVDSGQGEMILRDDVHNDGLICLRDMMMRHEGAITGNGCWVLSQNSYIEIDATRPFLHSQSIVLLESSAFVSIVKFGLANRVHDLYGFLRAEIPIRSEVDINGVTYDPGTGHLKFCDEASHFVIFNIGLGFEEGLFRISGKRRVTYEGKILLEKAMPLGCIDPNLSVSLRDN